MLIFIKFNILITQIAETKSRNVNNNFRRPKKLLLFAAPLFTSTPFYIFL